MTFIEDGIPSLIKKTNLINFAKRAKTAEVIRDIQQYQNVPYPLQAVPELQDYILTNMQSAGDVHEMYEMSLQVEPREREDEKIARYCFLSPRDIRPSVVNALTLLTGCCLNLVSYDTLSTALLCTVAGVRWSCHPIHTAANVPWFGYVVGVHHRMSGHLVLKAVVIFGTRCAVAVPCSGLTECCSSRRAGRAGIERGSSYLARGGH